MNNTESSALVSLGSGIRRLVDEAVWNGSGVNEYSNGCAAQKLINKLSDIEMNLVAYLFVTSVRKEYSFAPQYTPSILKQNSSWTYKILQGLQEKKIVKEYLLPQEEVKNYDPDLIALYCALASDDIRGIIEHIDSKILYEKSELSDELSKKALKSLLRDKLKCMKTLSFTDRLPFSFTALDAGYELRKLYNLSDVFCMLYGGEFSAIPSPCATVAAPERWEKTTLRTRQVLQHLASAPELDWGIKPKFEIGAELYKWTDGQDMAIDAYRITWKAYARLRRLSTGTAQDALPTTGKSRKKCDDWVSKARKKIRSIFRKCEKMEDSFEIYEKCEHHMENKLDIQYWAMQALHALAQCAMLQEEYNPAIQMYTMVTEHFGYLPCMQVDTLYNRILCHMEIKEKKKALPIAEKAISSVYSYTKPFEHMTEFINFHLLHEGKKFLRVGQRIGLERLVRELCPSYSWKGLQPLKLSEPDERTMRAESFQSRKRLPNSLNAATENEFVLAEYIQELGPSWTGAACDGKVISALCFLLTADVFQPDQKSEIAQYFFPSRWREVPLDFGTPQFFARRDYEIERVFDRIEAMSSSEIECEIRTQYAAYSDKRFGRLFKDFAAEDLVVIAQSLVEKYALMQLLQFFFIEGTIKGIPDVWMWTKKSSQGISDLKGVLVKGANETLRDDERAWMHVLKEIGIPTEVCRFIRAEEKYSGKEVKPKAAHAPSESESDVEKDQATTAWHKELAAKATEEFSDDAVYVGFESDDYNKRSCGHSCKHGYGRFCGRFGDDYTDDESPSDYDS